MLKKSGFLVAGFIMVISLSGCVTAKTYVVNKPRVDQDIPGMPVDQGPVKTRKVIVLEVIEKDKKGVAPAQQVADHGKKSVDTVEVSPEEKNFDLPQSAVAPSKDVQVKTVPQEYVVEKDDTLQKISKKVYGTYSKWTKIYDANRDVLKDPNFLKSGVKIKIPQL
ncbi:MAG: LysM peptidoglycan-binding domain-containing protein [Candidatus Omnitrophica bacterium]|nr:LysM peptidoglycan-binding domain-containing protein [Candidatus Omnitrophota bacterium]